MVTIDKNVCVGCGKCAADCVSMSLFIKEGKAEYTGDCIHCGHCVAICPVNAVSIPEYDMKDVEELKPDHNIEINSLLSIIKSRRSIRNYVDKKIEREKLDHIVQAGRYTATAVNRQECTFILVQEQIDALKKMIWDDVEKAVSNHIKEAKPLKSLVALYRDQGIDYFFRNAPAVMYIAAENTWDAGLAAQNMELAAVSQGLGVLYDGFLLGATKLSSEAQKFMGVDGKPLAVCMLMGYPDVKYVRTAPRKNADVTWL